MALLPLSVLALFVAAAFAGEISSDRLVGDFPEETASTAPPAQSTNKTGDRSGLEPSNPIYGGGYTDSGNGGFGDGNGISECQSLRYRNKCYYVAMSQESWYTGRDYCSRIGHTLARVESSDEATFLASYLYEGGHRNYWLDVNDERTEGVWTHADGTPAFTDFWAPNEPNGNRGENCGLLVLGADRIGRLVDDPCGEWRRYICERRSENVCRRAGYKRKCYWFSVQPATWFNAREYCATMGQRLARVTATDELNFLARIMPRPSWIDLRYGGQGVGWTYADGSSSASVAGFFGGGGYMGGFGGARCAELRRYNQKEGRSVASDCNALKQFICESESLPPGSELTNPEDMPGSVFGSPLGGPAMGPGGPVNPNVPSMGGGMAGMGMAMDPIEEFGPRPGFGGPGYGVGAVPVAPVAPVNYGMAGGYGR